MNDQRYTARFDPQRRLQELRQPTSDVEVLEPNDTDETTQPEEASPQAYSLLSANRHKVMCEYRFLDGNAKALSYSYLVAIEFNPSQGITLDYSGYTVRIEGRHLRPVFDGLAAHRVAMIREIDAFQAQANAGEEGTVVTKITVLDPSATT